MRYLIIVCGPIAAGKSTWLSDWEENDWTRIIQSDVVREELYGPDLQAHQSPQEHHEVWTAIHDEVWEWAHRPDSRQYLVVEGVLSKSEQRKALYDLVDEGSDIKIEVQLMWATLEECLHRNSQRPPHVRVPDDIVARKWLEWQEELPRLVNDLERCVYVQIEKGEDRV